MEDKDEKDYGPLIVGQMLGVCLSSYIGHGVTKDEVTSLVADMYDGIVESIKEAGLEPGFEINVDE